MGTLGLLWADIMQWIEISGNLAVFNPQSRRPHAPLSLNRWDRVQIAYEALLEGKGAPVVPIADLIATLNKRYEAKETDEFFTPIVVESKCTPSNLLHHHHRQ